MRLMSDDGPGPTRRTRQARPVWAELPGGEKRFLHDIFRLLEVPHVRQRIAKGHVLEPPDDVGKWRRVREHHFCWSEYSHWSPDA
jgi:hypothetical protein